VTDLGIAEEAILRALGRRATPADVAALRDRFVALLEPVLADHVGRLEVPGAAQVVQVLREEGREVAIATGSWEASARAKLHYAGIDVAGVPFFACDEEPERERILTNALTELAVVPGRDAIVYVGDGAWDFAAARKVGIAFVGVDHDTPLRVDADGSELARAGAFEILKDFEDGRAFLSALARAHRKVQNRSTA
jgi:phosphoglycolate phosphatase-like HAD superfamily hydrolase